MEGELFMKPRALTFNAEAPALETYTHKPNTAEIMHRLIITDNEAQTLDQHLPKWLLMSVCIAGCIMR